MKRISGYITEELHESILQMAAKENRSFAYMIDVLLQLAVKEKTRRRDAKKVHISDKPTNSHQSNTGG